MKSHLFLVALSLLAACTPKSKTGNNDNTNNNPCPGTQILCGETCVDPMTDDAHCGGCDRPCQQYAHCRGNGSCVLECPLGFTECGDTCAALSTDPAHCGECFRECAAGASCVEGDCDEETCFESLSEAEAGTLPADIVVVVDNSGTMGDEAASVQASMHALVATLVGSGIDAHVILISADSTEDAGVCVPAPVGSGNCPADENLPAFRHVVREVGSTNALELILSTYPEWSSSLRQGATRNILVITDDNSSMSAATFTSSLIALDPSFTGFKFSGIISPYEVDEADCILCEFLGTCNTGSCDKCCGTDTLLNLLCTPLPAEDGTVYRELIQATGGIEGNLCVQDFQPAFTDLATAVAWESAVECVYDIPAPPDGEVIDYDRINVDYRPTPADDPQTIYHVPGGAEDCGPEGGWYYDAREPPTQVLFCPATCDEVTANLSAVITVKFGCATIVR